MNSIKKINVKNKRVLLRADLNIPIKNGIIINDFKLKKILKTIEYIKNNHSKIILATHIGRPNASSTTNYFDKNLSTKILLNWFKKNGISIRYESDLKKAEQLSKEDFSEILLLENLRFFNGEKGEEKERLILARLLSNLSDVYINDAFALYHRDDCSVTELPQLFKEDEKAYGLLFESEIHNLNKIKTSPNQPFIVIIGGNKIETKIPLLNNMINKDIKNRPSSIIIGGSIAITFLKSSGKPSSTEKNVLIAKKILLNAKEKNIKIVLPVDYITEESIISSKSLSANDLTIDIGPKTIKLFTDEISKAKTIFVNGTMGIYQNNKSQNGTKKILQSIIKTKAYKVAGGGDCIAAIYMFNYQNKFDFLSTGGGATIKFIS